MKLTLKDSPKGTVLFVCVENAGRSQMAEGFIRKYAPNDYESTSAGTLPTSKFNPLPAEVMMEIGIDISNQKPKEIDDGMIRNSIKIISIGCMDKDFCPAMFVPRVVD